MLNKEVLRESLCTFWDEESSFFISNPKSFEDFAEKFSRSFFNYAITIFPVSISNFQAKEMMKKTILRNKYSNNTDFIEDAVFEFVKIIALGMSPLFISNPNIRPRLKEVWSGGFLGNSSFQTLALFIDKIHEYFISQLAQQSVTKSMINWQ